MSDPYRKLLLDHVNVIIKKDACKESLEELLKVASPSLTEEQLLTPLTRGAAFNTLLQHIHPANTNDNIQAASVLHQHVGHFYARCCSNLTATPGAKRRKKNDAVSPTGVNEFPQDFCVQDKWKFLDDFMPKVVTVSEEKLPALIAARCINARGAIAHGRATEISYLTNDLYKEGEGNAVVDIFKRKGNGTRVLDTVNEIKEELTKRGPVVSTSFVPSKELVSASEHKGSFLEKRVGKSHELLLIGWKFTPTGEVWLARPLRGDSIIEVAFGQFGVDDAVMAPESSFEDEYWQEGPYVFRKFRSKPQWYGSWNGVRTDMSENDLRALAISLGEGFGAAINNKSRLVICEEGKRARSRAAHLREVSWNKDKNMWKVQVDFTDDKALNA